MNIINEYEITNNNSNVPIILIITEYDDGEIIITEKEL
jgi:hypothetical protein